ncbi:ATP-binding cassette domain-containing protein [Anabaena cylindrica FACHB-243]|uniref:ABC transporter related protein n=1 Tax=Anabaena cylindrica (strain ATCC 27899 / PCC 7122) TaxID=272123 RepID=K9ZGF8_ANACC|nr:MULTISPECIES: ATP-binding cassette domain-containing protein [Anabaena]AFZ57834.1 ABC transporter related protein [Anabaena cylindrica PCC 7122]MBD2419255.1 ATP-binding cassette domain-containing protein [Anabaena cylindrica FACHB-243]MBY5284727.1 ATP-binding cassette domain-containing protein [Anabaena sp. CCAP 1446/1C]MBY5308357.1 ATP-binding cassette domain-containing protein [Anabaena sp. CCAP 1446/1C]MCM2408143.1 ATP-binding cassette domain-containing protein [Anabaena sp. CCAP 1446/1C
MSIIIAENLSKYYPVAIKEPGIRGTLTHFFRRTYRSIKAVQDVSFEIASGEVVGFLGPNGAGKTTTLKMLTGLIHPSSGTVRVAGHIPFRRQEAFLQKITLVMGQKQQLIWDLPALDSLRINAAVYNISDREFQHRVGELTEMLSLEGKLNQPVRKLSLGERMKAELLAALLHRPQVLFLDEPTLGLDVNAQVSVRDFLRDYNQLYQATVLLTSHYMADITALCKRVLLIHQGKLMYDGSLDGLLENFAPYREIYVELAHPLPAEKLMSYGDIQLLEGRAVRFIVQRAALTSTVSQILADLEVIDLTVTEPPVEEVIGRVFQNGFV